MVRQTDSCDTLPWSTFAPIVQEYRILLFLCPSHPRQAAQQCCFAVFPYYITPISTHRPTSPAPRASRRLSISKTRYSLDRYASRLSLFRLSNTRSTASFAMWVRIGWPLCAQLQQLQPQSDDLLRLPLLRGD